MTNPLLIDRFNGECGKIFLLTLTKFLDSIFDEVHSHSTFMRERLSRWKARSVRQGLRGVSWAFSLLAMRLMARLGVRKVTASSSEMEIPNDSSHPITISTESRPIVYIAVCELTNLVKVRYAAAAINPAPHNPAATL